VSHTTLSRAQPAISPPIRTNHPLALFGAAGLILFVLLATLAGLLQPGYDPRINSISEAALGPAGWLQTLNFLVFGASILAFAATYARRARPASRVGVGTLVLAGLAVAASGVFGTDRAGAEETPGGQVHNLLALVAFGAMIVSQLAAARAARRAGEAMYSALTAALSLTLLVLYIGSGSEPGDALYPVGGIIERGLIVVAFGWITVIGQRLTTRP
jgi:hypothetical membrane protein